MEWLSYESCGHLKVTFFSLFIIHALILHPVHALGDFYLWETETRNLQLQ